MTPAAQLRSGAVLRLDRELYKVVESVLHAGAGKAGGMVHVKLRSLSTGHMQERRWAPDDKVDALAIDRVKMQFVYSEAESLTFMNPQTFDQVPIPRSVIGPAADFLKEEDLIDVEFFEDRPVSTRFHDTVNIHVTSTGAGLRGKVDSTMKEAQLENGLTILVPQFIETGDLIEVEVETRKYVARVQEKSKP